MSRLESELKSDPIIDDANQLHRSGRGIMNVGLGTLLGNMLFVLVIGWVGPQTPFYPNAVLPHGPLAITGIAAGTILFGWIRVTRATKAVFERCEELFQHYRQGSD